MPHKTIKKTAQERKPAKARETGASREQPAASREALCTDGAHDCGLPTTREAPHIRREMAAAARAILNHFRKCDPARAHYRTQSALIQMKQALDDCRQLDQARKGRGAKPCFEEDFTCFNDDRALAGMHCRTEAELKAIREHKTPAFKAMLAGDAEKACRKTALELIRESLRDRWDSGCALLRNSRWIEQRLAACDAAFFEELGDLLRQHRRNPLQRNLKAWIVRTWLPLCLWECEPDGIEAHRRFMEAASLIGLNLEGADPAKFFLQFKRAWSNVRATGMKVRTVS